MFAPLRLTQVRGPECASYPSQDGVGLSAETSEKRMFGPNQASPLSKTAALSSGVPVEVGTCPLLPPRGGRDDSGRFNRGDKNVVLDEADDKQQGTRTDLDELPLKNEGKLRGEELAQELTRNA